MWPYVRKYRKDQFTHIRLPNGQSMELPSLYMNQVSSRARVCMILQGAKKEIEDINNIEVC